MQNGLHYSIELEHAVLGACLMEKEALGRCYNLVEPNHFYNDDHQKIFSSLLEMYDQNIPVDLITVLHFMLQKNIKLDNSDQDNYAFYLCKITNQVTQTKHLEYHSYILKEMWKLRELERLTNSGIDPTEDIRKQIAGLSDQLNAIRESEFKKDWFDMPELLVGLIRHQEDLKSGKKKFISTGFKVIDQMNGGFYDGQFVVIGARPSVGKSALMAKMATTMARLGKRVGIISLEMDNNSIIARLAALDTEFDFQTIYRNLFEDEEQHKRFYNAVANSTANLPLHISDKTRVDINEIKAKATRLKNRMGCDCLMIDYLQLVDSTYSRKNENREQEISKISRGLKLMANDMAIPIIALCQLNREIEKRSEKQRYPRLSDLRESGSLEQDADAVWMLHRDWEAGYETNEDGGSTEFDADLLGLKWRNGSKFHLQLEWEPRHMRFKEKPHFVKFKPTSELFDPTESKKTHL